MKISFRKARGKKGARYLARCGDCENRLEVFPPDFTDPSDELMEIGGVMGTIEEWRRLLLPLLDDPRWFRRMLDRRIKEAEHGKTIPAKEVLLRLRRRIELPGEKRRERKARRR